ncbi:SLN13 protein, partial [Bucorvus abyssinicus]|nr:SLN13 protein [Bucorvus abyssinicus]
LEDDQWQKVWVDLSTKYPEVVLCVGKMCFGEKARKKIPKNSKQDQKSTLARAVCALLNAGGGVIRAEIENESYNFQRDMIGLDLEENFRSFLLSPDWKQYLDFKQQDNYLLIFVKTWSSEKASSLAKPRICSLSTGLYAKGGASLSHVEPTEAPEFLKSKQEAARGEFSPESEFSPRRESSPAAEITDKTVAELFKRDQLRRGETLAFTESGYVEFKHFSTENFLTRVKEKLPQYVAGFANTSGGYFWIGVDDDRTVQGFSCNEDSLQNLIFQINSIQDKLTLFHFCGRGNTHNILYEHKIFKVYGEAGDHCGYVCAVKIQPFTCVAFSEDPDSWLVEGNTVRRLRACEWAARMTDADPDLSKFSEAFKLELSLSEGPPLAKPVYSRQGLDNVDSLCKQLFPGRIIYTPEKLCEDLCQEHAGLDILIKNQLNQLSEGVLMFSRSWAVDVGLPENPDVICDALLIAKGRPPILYTISKHPVSEELFEYSRQIAWRLKEKLVNTGGYIHKLCVIPQLLMLPPQTDRGTAWDLNIQEMYPRNYSLIHSGNLAALLRALTVALLTFRSFLSDHVGSEFLNLLTIKQYQLLSENLRKTKRLFVYGLPGTGKTIVALKIIEKIKLMLQCTPQEVLYVCENQPLRDFVRQKNICCAVTRVAFLNRNFNRVKHIIIDEAQNFRNAEGDWYNKASSLTSSRCLPQPGYFWIFLDYLQRSHCFQTGLPEATRHDPVEYLTEVVRNANSIYSYLKGNMEMIVKLHKDRKDTNVPSERLEELVCRATCAHAVQGCLDTVRASNGHEIAKYVAEHCRMYLQKGYSEKDIAILCYTDPVARAYGQILASELRKLGSNISLRKMEGGLERHTVLDSVRRFSGLERSIVFGIIPQSFPFQDEISRNMLVCLASRANLNLHLL